MSDQFNKPIAPKPKPIQNPFEREREREREREGSSEQNLKGECHFLTI